MEEINLYELYTEEELVELPQIQISFVSPDDENDQIQFSENCSDMAKPLMNENAI